VLIAPPSSSMTSAVSKRDGTRTHRLLTGLVYTLDDGLNADVRMADHQASLRYVSAIFPQALYLELLQHLDLFSWNEVTRQHKLTLITTGPASCKVLEST